MLWLKRLLSHLSHPSREERYEERYLVRLIHLTGVLFDEVRKKYPKGPETYAQILCWSHDVNASMTSMLSRAWEHILQQEAFKPYIEIDYPHYFITVMPKRPLFRPLSIFISALLNSGEDDHIKYPPPV